MKLQALQIFLEKLISNQTQKKVILLVFTLVLLTLIKLHVNDSSGSLLPRLSEVKTYNSNSANSVQQCDMFTGQWVENPKGSYYNDKTCDFQMDSHNCAKYGRRDEEFLKWRWKPDECELPFFDGAEFLEILKGKSMAFVGDSIARNQMQSLLCLLSSVASPIEIYRENTLNVKLRTWFYAQYNVTLTTFWSPYLVKSKDLDPAKFSDSSLMNIYLDQPDELWMNEIESFDYVIISAGIWFFRPIMLYENDRLVGCHSCDEANITKFEPWYGQGRAFRTAFSSLNRQESFKGVTILRTYSPSHYENGQWNSWGSCKRKLPLTRAETKVQLFTEKMALAQMEEFVEAEKKGLERGLKFRVLNVTEAMEMRPDGHPNHYVLKKNATSADCVHWCLPGPIDMWNELLLYMLKT